MFEFAIYLFNRFIITRASHFKWLGRGARSFFIYINSRKI